MRGIPLLLLPVLALFSGCRGGPPAGPKVTDDYFSPLPPDLPRVQFLRSYNGSTDFEKRRPVLDYLAGSQDTSQYEIKKPFSVATTRGKIYVTDSFGLQGVNVFDLVGRRFYILGRTPGSGEIKKPINIFVDPAGYKYICDVEKRQVIVYGPDDTYHRSYGDGASFNPVSCAVHGQEVYVLDMARDRVPAQKPGADPEEVRRDQVLVLDRESGQPLRRIGRHGSGKEGFSFASYLAVDRLGFLYVSDFLNHRVVKMNSRGEVFLVFGRHGDRAGDFSQMKGVAVDRQGVIYVVDAAFQNVQAFDASGRPLFAMGGPRAPQGPMDLPAGIWIDRENLDLFRDYLSPDFEAEYLILVANQLSPRHRIAVYAYGRKRGLDYSAQEKIVTLENAPAKPLWQMAVFAAEPPGAAAAPAEAGRLESAPPPKVQAIGTTPR